MHQCTCYVDLQHPPTKEEMKLAAVVEYRTRKAVAEEMGLRVSGATANELARRLVFVHANCEGCHNSWSPVAVASSWLWETRFCNNSRC